MKSGGEMENKMMLPLFSSNKQGQMRVSLSMHIRTDPCSIFS
jgi:hypothetical protein